MEFTDILQTGGVAVLVTLLSLIKIPKLEVNIWGLIGRAINKEQKEQNDKLQKSIDDLSKRLDAFIANEEIKWANESRRDILAFNDELLRDIRHSKERFNDVLKSIDEYEDYCDTHPLYKNNRADLAIKNIKQVYQMRQEQRDFL